jgi:hypothetical protein
MFRFTIRDLLWLMVVVVGFYCCAAIAQDKPDPGEALYGEWEVVEMVFKKTDQDFGGESRGLFLFEPGGFLRFGDAKQRDTVMGNGKLKMLMTDRCIIRQDEIDIWHKPFLQKNAQERLLKCHYDLQDGKLRFIWRDGDGERPTDFDEAYKDPQLTYFLLTKAK